MQSSYFFVTVSNATRVVFEATVLAASAEEAKAEALRRAGKVRGKLFVAATSFTL